MSVLPRLRAARLGRLVATAACAVAAACHHVPSGERGGAIRVLVLNMHAGTDAAGRDNLDRVAALVRETGADLVLLQEVDSAVARSGRVDQPAELARRTGFYARFGNALAYQGGGYGVATLSRWPITDARLVRLPVDPPQERAGGSHEPRGVLEVTVAAPGGPLHVLNTHLDPSADDHWRRQEADSVLSLALTARAGGVLPVLVGGDFNSTPDSEVQARLRAGGLSDLWPTCGEGDGLTYPVEQPVKRIDYLYALGGMTCERARVLESDASDHRGVLFTVWLAR
ncbi:MAG TPA: endonuclease/exonuclease/phosphatase family protein [Gemmatimonadaceae bacterium]|nr:endonuclease/exonuclease/phosphatase family protein [Gemmatimonadaceae bacterium]